MDIGALERQGSGGREVKIHVIGYSAETPQLFTGHAHI